MAQEPGRGVLRSGLEDPDRWAERYKTEGKAGMAAISAGPDFDLDALGRYVVERLPAYQRPYFVRLQTEGVQVTGTFKHQKNAYREEGYDPAKVRDPLYVLEGDRYVKLDPKLYQRLLKGELALR